MTHQQPTDEVLELAAPYALGALDPDQRATFEAHLAEGCRACEREANAFAAVVGHLGGAVPPRRPRPQVRGRLLASLGVGTGGHATVTELAETGAVPPLPDWTIIRSTEGEWEAGPVGGLLLKRLFLDPAELRFTALVRMQGGVHYPSHRHADTEELYLLAGDFAVEGQVLRAGDYCGATAGTAHGVTYSEGGCTFLLVACEREEIVEESGAEVPQTGLRFIRSTEGMWREGGVEGVEIKPLFSDPARGTLTALVRMQAGSKLPRHRHVTVEQFYMLEGDGHVAGQVLQAGDYFRAAVGTVHEVTYTEGGCVFLLMASKVEVLG